MIRQLLLLLLLFVCLSVTAQQLPETEIYLFNFEKSKTGFQISQAENISNHKGYDNQPFFHPKNPLIYFASSNSDGRTEIASYNYKSKQIHTFTTSSEREYSPTVTPDQQFISCIIQRDSGQQDLGKYPINGGEPVIIIDNLVVGYHAWADASDVFVFVLGDTMTLQHFNVETKTSKVIAKNIGRSLHRIPGSTSISFVDKSSDEKWIIKKVDSKTGRVDVIAETIPSREDMGWLNENTMLMTSEKSIHYLNLKKKHEGWKVIQQDVHFDKLKFTRLAIGPRGDKLAVVTNE